MNLPTRTKSDARPPNEAPLTSTQAPSIEQAEFPALNRADELQGQYFRDLWQQARIIARQRGANVQRTIEDVSLADTVLRSGFRKRRSFWRGVGQVLSYVGAILAGIGGGGLWMESKPQAHFGLFFMFLVGGMVIGCAGILLERSLD